MARVRIYPLKHLPDPLSDSFHLIELLKEAQNKQVGFSALFTDCPYSDPRRLTWVTLQSLYVLYLSKHYAYTRSGHTCRPFTGTTPC